MNPLISNASPAVGRSIVPYIDHDPPAIRTATVYVIHTSIEETLSAVRVASNFAKTLDVPVTIVHIRAVPYALPVDEPGGISPVETTEFVARLRAASVDAKVHAFLCRDRRTAIPAAFKSHSLIVVAGQHRWWRTEADFWRRALEAAGHFVVFVDQAEHKEKSHA